MGNRNRSWGRRGPGARAHRAMAAEFELALRGENRKGGSFDPSADRKTLQLCRQVQRALMLALAAEADLLDASVEGVDPAGGGHLLVRVSVPESASVVEMLARLNSRAVKLRAIVASSICRKRAPMLSFIAVAAGNGGTDA